MSIYESTQLLILAKTYPIPSNKYRETTCVVASTCDGKLVRLYTIPFRLLEDSRFTKWQWIRANITKATGDNRPESYRIDADSIELLPEKLTTEGEWLSRRPFFEPHSSSTLSEIEARRLLSGETLAVLRPSKLLRLEVTAVKQPDWTDDEIRKLTQLGLSDSSEIKARPLLEKLGHDFHYIYECATPEGITEHKHKITDWEAGALYRNCRRNYGTDWESFFRKKLEAEFSRKDLHFLMGTIHRFPDHWLIVGLIYPPKTKLVFDAQLNLF